MKQAIAMIPLPTQPVTIEGAGHNLGGGRFDPTAFGASLSRTCLTTVYLVFKFDDALLPYGSNSAKFTVPA